jgi:hypothetical protein
VLFRPTVEADRILPLESDIGGLLGNISNEAFLRFFDSSQMCGIRDVSSLFKDPLSRVSLGFDPAGVWYATEGWLIGRISIQKRSKPTCRILCKALRVCRSRCRRPLKSKSVPIITLGTGFQNRVVSDLLGYRPGRQPRFRGDLLGGPAPHAFMRRHSVVGYFHYRVA